jgi:hypothetical protein
MDEGPRPVVENAGKIDDKSMQVYLHGYQIISAERFLALRGKETKYLLDGAP